MKSFNEWRKLKENHSPEEIDSELQNLANKVISYLRKEVEPTRQYQLERKKEVAKAFGVHWSTFDLPFAEWDPISSAWYHRDYPKVRRLAAKLRIYPTYGAGSGDDYDIWLNKYYPKERFG